MKLSILDVDNYVKNHDDLVDDNFNLTKANANSEITKERDTTQTPFKLNRSESGEYNKETPLDYNSSLLSLSSSFSSSNSSQSSFRSSSRGGAQKQRNPLKPDTKRHTQNDYVETNELAFDKADLSAMNRQEVNSTDNEEQESLIHSLGQKGELFWDVFFLF